MIKKNKKIYIAVLLVGILITILCTILIINNNKLNKKPNKNNKPKENIIRELTYEEAKQKAVSIYKTNNTNVSVENTDDGYKITVRDIKTNKIQNTFNIDKKTGIISEITEDALFTIEMPNKEK